MVLFLYLAVLQVNFFVYEFNKYRVNYVISPVTWNGVYSDMMTWAAFDQITQPGQFQYYQKHFSGSELHSIQHFLITICKIFLKIYEKMSKTLASYLRV